MSSRTYRGLITAWRRGNGGPSSRRSPIYAKVSACHPRKGGSGKTLPAPRRTWVHKRCVMRDGLPGRAQRIHNFSYKLGAARAKGERTMTEASAGRVSRAEVQRSIVQRSLQD